MVEKSQSTGLLSVVLSIWCIIAWHVPVLGQGAIADGITFLELQQDASGLWNVGGDTEFRDAAAALRVLALLEGDTAVINAGATAINAEEVKSSDYLARQIMGLNGLVNQNDIDNLIEELLARQNADGGWGYRTGYASNVLETALGLQALATVGSENTSALSGAVGYLLANQNVDGGFSFMSGDSSRVYYTALAAIALKLVENQFSVGTALQNATNWLISQQQGDNGFGTGGSNPYETGLALTAIALDNPTSTAVADAIDYLESSQHPNGSWNNDVYSTAVVLFGLYNTGPDVRVQATNISFTPANPVDSQQVTIVASIRNGGATDVTNVTVRFFDGDPNNGGVQISGDQNIAAINSGSSAFTQVMWDTYGLAGDHTIYVVVDPEDDIVEAIESNNSANKNVHVSLPPDLYIDADGIQFNPAAPDVNDNVSIATTVKNLGEVNAVNVPIHIYRGNPDSGGTQIFNTTIGPIAAGGQFLLNLDMGNYFNQQEWYVIWVCVDEPNNIREVNEENNCQVKDLVVGPQVVAASMTYCAGLNLLALPIELYDVTQPMLEPTMFSILPEIPTATELSYWESDAQRWSSAALTPSGSVVGEDHYLRTTDGFFARVTSEDSFDFMGKVPPTNQCLDLNQGLNLIGVPDQTACYTAFTLLESITSGEEAHRWNCMTQSWQSAFKDSEGTFTGIDFPVERGSGYLVRTGGAEQWCIGVCDTLGDLPDLEVLAADIFISPNPVPAGDSTFIGMSVRNNGTATANNPQIHLFSGDPDAGGTLLLFGSIGTNIPPGGIIGPLGNWVDVPSPGSFEIYGVADYPNEIVESNESNNQASATLVVNPSAVAPNPGKDTDALAAFTQDATEPTVFRRLAEPTVRTYDTRPNEADAVDNTTTSFGVSQSSKSGSRLAAAATISQVNTMNLTSASATITWLTEEIVGGNVHYGLASDSLGDTITVPGADDNIHMVELSGLDPNTTYYFEVESDSTVDDNGGSRYQFTTTDISFGQPYIVYGTVLQADSISPFYNALVTVQVKSDGMMSNMLGGLTSVTGMWSINLGNLKDTATGLEMDYSTGDTIFVTIVDGTGGLTEDAILVDGGSPQDGGTNYLGSGSCCLARGNVNGMEGPSGPIDVADITYLVAKLWQGGPEPPCEEEGNVNNLDGPGGPIDVADLTYLIAFVWQGGPEPPPCD